MYLPQHINQQKTASQSRFRALLSRCGESQDRGIPSSNAVRTQTGAEYALSPQGCLSYLSSAPALHLPQDIKNSSDRKFGATSGIQSPSLHHHRSKAGKTHW